MAAEDSISRIQVNFQYNAGPQCAQQVVIDAIPVSTFIPNDYDYEKYGDPKLHNYDVFTHEAASDVKALTKLDRQRNWYIEARPRKSGIVDKFYTHLGSDIRCRSLSEVYKFVEYGTKSTKQQPDIGDANQVADKKQRGSSFIEQREVGYFVTRGKNSQSCTGYIYRKKPGEPEFPQAAKKGRRRKKGEENAAENENKGEYADSPAPIRDYTIIHDLVPIK